MAKITLLPSQQIIEVDSNDDLLELLRKEGIFIRSGCGGYASCSDCKIKLESGVDFVTPPTFEEIQLLGNVFHITKERLACQTKVTGDITIDISNHDPKSAEASLQNKSKKRQTRVRKKDDVAKIVDEREKSMEESDLEQSKWTKHWEQDKKPSWDKRKKLDGGKRPRPFRDLEDREEKAEREKKQENKKDED